MLSRGQRGTRGNRAMFRAELDQEHEIDSAKIQITFENVEPFSNQFNENHARDFLAVQYKTI